jgi:protein-S-isoprenylcysteine O-methyltransferase Ste14
MLIKKGKAKYPRPSFNSVLESISVFFSTLFFWGYLILSPILSRTEEMLFLTDYLTFELQLALVSIGMLLMTYGIIIASLGRIGRGVYLSKNEPHLATNWGHAIVRHPEYTMYIVCFIGLPFVSLSPYLLIFLLGIPGYIITTRKEEEELIEEFGDEYKLYMQKVGRFFPRRKKLISFRDLPKLGI